MIWTLFAGQTLTGDLSRYWALIELDFEKSVYFEFVDKLIGVFLYALAEIDSKTGRISVLVSMDLVSLVVFQDQI